MSVDLRTRVDAQQIPVEGGCFFRETLPALLDAHQALIAPGAGLAGSVYPAGAGSRAGRSAHPDR